MAAASTALPIRNHFRPMRMTRTRRQAGPRTHISLAPAATRVHRRSRPLRKAADWFTLYSLWVEVKQIRNRKLETRANPKTKTGSTKQPRRAAPFPTLEIRASNLFRIWCFGFGALIATGPEYDRSLTRPQLPLPLQRPLPLQGRTVDCQGRAAR